MIEHYDCACMDVSHSFRFWRSADSPFGPELFGRFALIPTKPLLIRIAQAIRYVFARQYRIDDFHDVIIRAEDAERLRDLFQAHLDEVAKR